jgi:hypothetical protein
MHRRTFLVSVAGSLLVATGAAGAFIGTRTPHRALVPWQQAGMTEADPRLFAFRHAVLAPNPHNRQPWIVELVGTDRANLFADPNRRLPMTDPFDRQIAIGLGCFLETARIAAAERGIRVEIEAFPDGEPQGGLDGRRIAALRFVADASVPRDPLFAAIGTRRSTKEPFDTTKPVATDQLARLRAESFGPVSVDGTADPTRVSALRAVAWKGHEVESLTPRTMKESVDLMRIGRAEIEANPDGIDLGGPFLETLKLLGQLSREQIADPTTAAFRSGMDIYRAMHASSMAFVWLTTPTATFGEALATGRVLVRMNLVASTLGLGFHPVSQTLQEFPEMAGLRAEVHRALDAEGRIVQMLVRLGTYVGADQPSPRWPLETRLKRA